MQHILACLCTGWIFLYLCRRTVAVVVVVLYSKIIPLKEEKQQTRIPLNSEHNQIYESSCSKI